MATIVVRKDVPEYVAIYWPGVIERFEYKDNLIYYPNLDKHAGRSWVANQYTLFEIINNNLHYRGDTIVPPKHWLIVGNNSYYEVLSNSEFREKFKELV